MTAHLDAMRLAYVARLLNHVCAVPPMPLRSLAFAMVSHQTLLRSTGPLGMWAIDPKERETKQRANAVLRQTAIIASGLMLGIVFKNSKGELEVR